MASRSDSAAPVTLGQGAGRALRSGPPPAQWAGDLSPVAAADWSFDLAGQLIERAGFGGTPEEGARLADMGPQEAVAALLHYRSIPARLAPFQPFHRWGPPPRPFPPCRVAPTQPAQQTRQ